MKIRDDFVTNSSSSSFIIKKIDGVPATVESVYQEIRRLYIDTLDSFSKLVKGIANGEIDGVEIIERNGFISFDYELDNRKTLTGRYGDVIDSCLCIADLKWVKCESYDEYERYWIEKINENKDDWYVHAPFTIRNMTDKLAKFVHNSEEFDSPTDISNQEIVSWYEWECGKTITLDGICINSECGYIDDVVVHALGKISTHWCNHMG